MLFTDLIFKLSFTAAVIYQRKAGCCLHNFLTAIFFTICESHILKTKPKLLTSTKLINIQMSHFIGLFAIIRGSLLIYNYPFCFGRPCSQIDEEDIEVDDDDNDDLDGGVAGLLEDDSEMTYVNTNAQLNQVYPPTPN
jgi:hypothetical protein